MDANQTLVSHKGIVRAWVVDNFPHLNIFTKYGGGLEWDIISHKHRPYPNVEVDFARDGKDWIWWPSGPLLEDELSRLNIADPSYFEKLTAILKQL